MAQQTEIKACRTIQSIKDMLEELACNPDDYDTFKMACEVYQLSREDAEIAENMKDYWKHLADGAEK